MTITYKNGAVTSPRRSIEITTRSIIRSSYWGDLWLPQKHKITLMPSAKDSSKDLVVIASKDINPLKIHTVEGPHIKGDSECKKFGIGWYK